MYENDVDVASYTPLDASTYIPELQKSKPSMADDLSDRFGHVEKQLILNVTSGDRKVFTANTDMLKNDN